MKRSVYIETSIVSYLTARPSRQPANAVRQLATRAWWKQHERFNLFVSETVREEASRGDADAARRRLEALHGIEVLEASSDVNAIAMRLLRYRAVPASATSDGTHVALAIANGLDYLLTWNCRHMANNAARIRIEEVCREVGRRPPVICTPGDLIGD